MDITSNEPSLYPYGIKVNECSISCNNINDPYSKTCVPHVVNVFNLMSRTTETRHKMAWNL